MHQRVKVVFYLCKIYVYKLNLFFFTVLACENSEPDLRGLFEEHPFLLDLMVEQEEEEEVESVAGEENIDVQGIKEKKLLIFFR